MFLCTLVEMANSQVGQSSLYFSVIHVQAISILLESSMISRRQTVLLFLHLPKSELFCQVLKWSSSLFSNKTRESYLFLKILYTYVFKCHSAASSCKLSLDCHTCAVKPEDILKKLVFLSKSGFFSHHVGSRD